MRWEEPWCLHPPSKDRIVGGLLLHRLAHCAIYIALGIVNIATSEMQTGLQHRLGDHLNAVASIESHLLRDHAVEMLWLRVWEALLEFVRQHAILLRRVEADQRSPRLMGRLM